MNYVYLAHAYLKVGQKKLAKASLQRALDLDPTLVVAKQLFDAI